LIISLANTREVLYLVNRPGNVVSHEGYVPWIDRAIELVAPHTGEITLRGYRFHLDRRVGSLGRPRYQISLWHGCASESRPAAEALPEEAWKPLERLPRYEIATEPHRKPPRVKEAIVRFKGYLNKKLLG
jgi:hypothetical protein